MGLVDFPFRKKYRSKDPTPPWLMGLLVFFLLYAATQYYKEPTATEPNPVRENIDKTVAQLNPAPLVDKFLDYRRMFFPFLGTQLEIKDIVTGQGVPAVCGQEVKIAYTTTIIGGKELGENASAEKPRLFSIGQAQVTPALEQGVNGMRVGGKRNIISGMDMTYGIQAFARPDEAIPADADILYAVELLGMTHALPDIETTPYRIANVADVSGAPRVYCGYPARVHVTLWDVAGKKLFSSKGGEPVTFTPGKSEVFLGLEQGVIGMSQGGSRTLVVPPEFFKTLHGKPPTITFPLPKSQTVLVDVEAIP